MDKTQIKLQAIQSKDLDAILEQQVDIPGLGTEYNKPQLQAWLDARANVLIAALKMTDKQIGDAITALSTEVTDKTTLGKVQSKENVILDSESPDYEKLIIISLYEFARV